MAPAGDERTHAAMNPRMHTDRAAYRNHPSWNNSVRGREWRRDFNGRPYVVGYAHVKDEELARLLLATRIKDLFTDISSMTIPLSHFGHVFVRSADVLPTWVSMHVHVPAIAWTYPWSIEQLGSALRDVVSARNARGVSAKTTDPIYSGQFELIFKRRSKMSRRMSCTVEGYLRTAFEAACSMVDEATTNLAAGIKGNSLMRVFRFPREISVPCEQYLLYFAQFLRDLGIESSAEIRHQADQILFHVIPATGTEALERIAAALNVYLRMSSMPPSLLSSEQNSDIAVAQLRANVLHLQSQLQLAQGTIQAKDASIQLLSIAGFQHEKPADLDADDKEPLLGKAITVTPFRLKGIQFNLPYILRQLRRRLSFRRNKR